jgi:hypothetical protein
VILMYELSDIVAEDQPSSSHFGIDGGRYSATMDTV